MRWLLWVCGYWSWPLERLALALIDDWQRDGSPSDWRLRLIAWAWMREDRRASPDSWRGAR